MVNENLNDPMTNQSEKAPEENNKAEDDRVSHETSTDNSGTLNERPNEKNGDVKTTTSRRPKKKPSRKSLYILIVVIAVIVIVGGIAGVHYKKEQELKKYQENLNQIDQDMLTGAATAEKAAGMIHDVWYDTIFDKRFESDTKDYVYPAYGDFNKAISNYCSSNDYIVKKAVIQVKVNSVNKLMKDMKNPPDEYEDAYDDLKNYYDDFIEFTDLALNPSGNLTTYTSNYNELDSAVAKDHKSFQIYLDSDDD